MAQVLDIRTDPVGAIEAAANVIADGRCIVLPTDTVYGIGANAFDPSAVTRLLNAKQRGREMPPPVLVADAMALRTLALEVSAEMTALAEAFWPGALTMVITAQPSLRMDLGERGATVAVRVPDHDFSRELLRATGPLAVSSANISGEAAATTVEQAKEQLWRSVKLFLDGGPAAGSVPSTIVDLTGQPRILRTGRISADQLREVVPELAEA
jgi:L-threonylcarbamoyladenylate synthase